MKNTFTYPTPYYTFKECFFTMARYRNGNLYLGIESEKEGPIADCTVNPCKDIPRTQLAIKNYSENAGMANFLAKQGIIETEPSDFVYRGFVAIPIYNLTEKGLELFKDMN